MATKNNSNNIGNDNNLNNKNLIILCDGTANQVSVYSETNIVRIAELLDKGQYLGKRQILFYDTGLGTEGAKEALTGFGKLITKLLGLGFGYGLSKNLEDAYAFLMQNYEPGDRIYIFGFSRGAFTARALTGLLGRVGLLDRGCNSLIPTAIKYYKEKNDHKLNFFKKRFSRTYDLKWGDLITQSAKTPDDLLKKESKGVIPVHFLGVWDTVMSIGFLRHRNTLPDTDWLPNMVNGRHAIAIHERRSQYKPELWDSDTDNIKEHEKQKKDRKFNYQICLHEDVKTKWFPGVHADVGGGYGLSTKRQKELIAIKKNLKEITHIKLPEIKEKLSDLKTKIYPEILNDLRQKNWDNILLQSAETITKNDNIEDTQNLKLFVTIVKKYKSLSERESAINKELYDETELAYDSLEWMIESAKEHHLRFDEKAIEEKKKKLNNMKNMGKKNPVESKERNVTPKMHEPLLPFWWVLGWKKRKR